MQELWKSLKDVVDNGDNYEVSNLGNVRSVKSNKLLKHRIDEYGYCRVGLWLGRKQKGYQVHRLVALAFLPNPENKPEVNHKDGDKTNCKLDNIEWTTRSENMKHAYKTGLSQSGVKKLTAKEVIEIKKLLIKGVMQQEISEMFNISKSVISQISKGVTWTDIYVEGFDEYLKKQPKLARSKNKGKLTESDVIKIRNLYETGDYSYKDLGEMFGVFYKTIKNIIKRDSWKHVN